MDRFVDVMSTTDLDDGAMAVVEAAGKKVLIARAGEAFHATGDRCPHLKGNLVKGTLEGTTLTCPLHHSQFDVTDGRVLRWTDWKGPLLAVGEALRHPRGLTTYEVQVEDGRVLVSPERPAADIED